MVAYGGDLAPERLLDAYRRGIFPWFNDDAEPVLWWSPDPRAVMPPGAMHVSRRLRRRLRSCTYRVTFDEAFRDVVAGCAAPAPKRLETWITPRMKAAYARLHEAGFAHSVEVWRGQEQELVGGLYGISLGRMNDHLRSLGAVVDAAAAVPVAGRRQQRPPHQARPLDRAG